MSLLSTKNPTLYMLTKIGVYDPAAMLSSNIHMLYIFLIYDMLHISKNNCGLLIFSIAGSVGMVEIAPPWFYLIIMWVYRSHRFSPLNTAIEKPSSHLYAKATMELSTMPYTHLYLECIALYSSHRSAISYLCHLHIIKVL